jgi:DNA-binding beta-propeller fold protein YncE
LRTLSLLGLLSLVVSLGAIEPTRAGSARHPLTASGCKQRAGQVGQVRKVRGSLSVAHGRQRWQRARHGTALYAKDRLRAAPGGRASVALCSGGVLYLNANTDVTVRSPLVAQVKAGEVAEIAPAGKKRQVVTAQATTSGSSFDVRIKNRASQVVGLGGAVTVKNRRGSVVVHPSQATVVRARSAPDRPRTVDARQAVAWTTPLGTWKVITANGLLSEPRRIALDRQGNLYVSDQYHNRVVKLSSSGKLLAAWGSPGSSSPFISPYGIALDDAGNIYVADEGKSAVLKLSPSGTVVATVAQACTAVPGCTNPSAPGSILGSEGVALDSHGNVYVADTDYNRIQKFSPSGQFIATWGAQGSEPGHFSLPAGVAVDGLGHIYVADTINNRIQKLSPDGKPLAVWGSRGSAPGQFYGPTDVTVAPDGNIYVADAGNNRIQELSPDGRPLQSWGSGGTRPGEFISPEGVAVDSSGNLYVVDRSNGRIERYGR